MISSAILLKERFTEISLDEQNGIINAKWIGFLKVDEVKTGCSEMSEIIKQHNITKHISDHTDLRVLSKEVQDYLTNEWFPEVTQLGLRKVAVVLSEDVFAQATVNYVNIKSQKDQLIFNTFDSYEAAIQWLNQ